MNSEDRSETRSVGGASTETMGMNERGRLVAELLQTLPPSNRVLIRTTPRSTGHYRHRMLADAVRPRASILLVSETP